MRFALVTALVLKASLAFAQAPQLLYLSTAYPWDPADAAARVNWAIPDSAVKPADVSAVIDGGQPITSPADCDVTVSGGLRWCHTMTPEMRTLLNVPGVHRVQIQIGSDVSANFLLTTPTPQPTTCPFTSLTGVASPPQPAGTYMGAFRAIGTDALMDAFTKRNGQLKSWGWIVDWKPVAIGGTAYGALSIWCLHP